MAFERAFVGTDTGTLEWGPALFRLLLGFHGLCLIALAFWLARQPDRLHERLVARPVTPGGVSAAIVALCLVGLAMRLWQLGTDLWLDEVLTVVDFLRRPVREIVAVFPSQNQHPFYSVLARLAVVWFGESAATVRLPSVLFGVGSIWAVFLLGRRIATEREALLAAALMTFSYHHVWFSQNARGYMGLLFFSIVATWLWIGAVAHGSGRRWIAYAICIWLGTWIHMTMLFVLAAHGLVYLGMFWSFRAAAPVDRDSGFRWKAPAAWFFAGTVTLQAHALALPEFLRSALHEVSLESEWINPLWVVQESVQRLADGGLGGVVLVAALATFGAGFASYWRRDARVAVLLLAPAVLGGATMLALMHNLWPRFFFFCMGFFLLIAIRGALVVPQWVLTRLRLRNGGAVGMRLGTTACVLLIAVSAATVPRSYLPKQDFSGAKHWVESRRQPGEEVVAVGLAGLAYRRYYAPEWTVVDRREDLEALQQNRRGVWLVYTLPVHAQAWLPDIWGAIQQEYEIVRVFPGTLGGGEVVVCRWRGGRTG